ncbi:RagB/SusD family nutrient uptake outer membrane protein [Sphingobacterium deserti]|uniref:RagB/SusD domain-containing protein n=1 Tax=Sphingobacterium deserti TaxID=1229276 RepID=A0A0B8SYX7_9SPHI|nr:RagB/SusD family nutrient uptake outer membrane protein [Sphingobacterium deserti]KGE12692.1 hypothetical protein DI53_3431 [Sphingobacterium deserti]
MKNYLYIGFILSVILHSSCNDDFLDRSPQTSVTEESTFKTVADLEIYTNSMYGMLSPAYSDGFSDNIAALSGASTTNNMVRGTLTAANADGWDDWESLRRINFMLQNLHKAVGDQAAIDHFTGIARFYRAYWYYNMVMRYGDVPWYGRVLGEQESEELTKGQDSRELVVDSIMVDLEYAAAHIQPSGTNMRITRWAALALMSRIALYEGSYRKYHGYLNLATSANMYFEKAASAAKQVMDEGGFALHSTGNHAEDFRSLFSSSDLSANKEIIFLWKNSRGEGVANNTHTVFDYQWAFSKDLMEEFLMSDGSRFTDLPGYESMAITEIFRNRDPRLGETMMQPGFKTNPQLDIPYVLKPTFGGYLQVKFYPRDRGMRLGWNLNYTDLPILRYAEVLLNYAEAKAELGTLDQSDLDATVGQLRQRVGLPKLDLLQANADVDPQLATRYPNVNENKGVVLEIRRERRVELAGEGSRANDLNRWFVGELFATAPKGMFVKQLGAMDVTGDGNPDIAILESPSQQEPIANLPEDTKERLVRYYLSENVIYLSNGNSGHIMFTRDKTQPRLWKDGPQYYYRPIPLQQTVLNPNLRQPFGWE